MRSAASRPAARSVRASAASLAESELAISANVDDKFARHLIVSLTPENTVSVEEAHGIVTALPNGLTPKFGRFFSGSGI